ncbi:MAG: mechanosensitive ion channel [Gammaproteobacteria bacterium]|nr:mechanosensitive ion channel [Gammaproteobacteria bacterium]MDE0365231.1 mechanosensitive ion channel [Gammaproteobacteria bacterium]
MFELNASSELVGLVVLTAGVAIAFATRTVIARLTDRHARDSGAFARIIRALAPLAFWGVLAAAVGLSLRVLGIGQAAGLIDEALIHLPRLIIAVLVIAAGHLIGAGLREFVQRRAGAVRFPPRGAYWLAAGPAIIIAAQQLGIDVSFIADLALLAFGIASAALGLAFALGARQHVANLIARRELDGYRKGDRLRVDDTEGTVVELRRTGIVLATSDGLVTIPAARFAEAPVVRLAEASE